MAAGKTGTLQQEKQQLKKIERRKFLQLSSGVLALLLNGAVLTGCGGGGSGSQGGGDNNVPLGGGPPLPPEGSLLFSRTVENPPAGAEVTDAERGIRLLFPAGAITSSAPVGIEVHQAQRQQATSTAFPGFTANPNAIDLIVDPASLSPDLALLLEVPLPVAYHPLGSMMFLTDDQGNELPLRVSHDAGRNVLVGSIFRSDLEWFAALGTRSRSRGRADGKNRFGVYVSAINDAAVKVGQPFRDLGEWAEQQGAAAAQWAENKGEATGKFVAKLIYDNERGFFLYEPATGAVRRRQAEDTMIGKRVAVLVHGMMNDCTDMVDLARFLTTELQAQTGFAVYDQVWFYQYDWKRPIRENGDLFAQSLSSTIASSSVVDLYSHSMGGVVSRWALEQSSLGGSIHRLLTLGTPHRGVPHRAAQALVRKLASFKINIASSLPGVDDLVADPSDQTKSNFVNQLNQGTSSFLETAHYFTLAGTKFEGYIGPIGDAINQVYRAEFVGGVQNDGIVPRYSALCSLFSSSDPLPGSGLSIKSKAWLNNQLAHTANIFVTHNELNGQPEADTQKTVMDQVVRWIVAPVKGVAR